MIRTTPARLRLVLALALAGIYNLPLWGVLLDARPIRSARELPFLVASFVVLLAINLIVLTLFAWKPLQKPVAALVLLGSAIATYAAYAYGTIIDGTMIRNLAETVPAEAGELITVRAVLAIVVLAVVPIGLLCVTRLEYASWRSEATIAISTIVLAVCSIFVVAGLYMPDYIALFNVEPRLRRMAVPVNWIKAVSRYGSERAAGGSRVAQPVGRDAYQTGAPGERRRRLTVLVVGETARAESFSLNGYGRPTNPQLASKPVISFRNVSSCGTSTAQSVPCMFSAMTRETFAVEAARSSEGLLDVLEHAGVNVLWRENNTGCKGVCDRVEVQTRAEFAAPGSCSDEGCFDMALLDGLDEYLETTTGDVVVVLHQIGSHGPAYYLRYPDGFASFGPECRTNDLRACDLDALANTYDNTIVYTDHVLARTIEFLERRSDRFETAMLYVSDHGESLGRDRIYLHGLPYFMAPDEQTRVPMVVWLSDELRRGTGIDEACLGSRRDEPLSHDNLFHTVLGLMDVSTAVYDPALDFMSRCRTTTIAADVSTHQERL